MARKHTTTACQICRDSKIKCDGERPTCGSCLKKNKFCEYSAKDDKRRISLRTAVDVLFNRVEQLTELTNKNGLFVPPLTPYEESVFEQICANLELPLNRIVPTSQPQTSLIPLPTPTDLPTNSNQFAADPPFETDLNLSALANPTDPDQSLPFDLQSWTDFSSSEPWNTSPSDWPWQLLNDFSGLPSGYPDVNFVPIDGDQQTPQGKNENSNDQTASGSSSEDEIEADIVPRLAARFGSLRVGADGRVRFYGSASNHHFLANTNRHETNVDVNQLKRKAFIALEEAQLDREVPEALENHLLDLFFKWHNPCHSTVDRSLFEKARSQDPEAQNAFCSMSLIAAMCAIGAAFEGRYHQSFITFPKPLAEHFADKAKVLLELELDTPCVSTLHTILLLSSHEAAVGRDARMWLYSGMAMRLAFDIGVHIDSDPYVEQGLFTAEEAEARRSSFWSCLVVNQLWSFSLGRPFRVDSEEITVKRLDGIPRTQSDPWSSWPTEFNPSTQNQSRPASTDVSSLVLQQWVSICDELAPLIRVLYGCVKISKAQLQNMSRQSTSRLLQWEASLPESLKIQKDRVTLPQVLTLHMAFHNFCILTHRPWTSKASQPTGMNGVGHQHARSICRKSASEIASLLRNYESHYGFRTMNVYVVTIIFSASLILIFGLIAGEGGSHHQQHHHHRQHSHHSQEDEPQQEQQKLYNVAADLNTCFRALDELSQSFECAKRTRENLLALQNHWSQMRRDAQIGINKKRRKQLQGTDGGDVANKRSRNMKNPSLSSGGMSVY